MAQSIRLGIIGAGWPGAQHARGHLNAGSFKLAAVADLIPDRRPSPTTAPIPPG
jgi:predicted dehydrogenase